MLSVAPLYAFILRLSFYFVNIYSDCNRHFPDIRVCKFPDTTIPGGAEDLLWDVKFSKPSLIYGGADGIIEDGEGDRLL